MLGLSFSISITAVKLFISFQTHKFPLAGNNHLSYGRMNWPGRTDVQNGYKIRWWASAQIFPAVSGYEKATSCPCSPAGCPHGKFLSWRVKLCVAIFWLDVLLRCVVSVFCLFICLPIGKGTNFSQQNETLQCSLPVCLLFALQCFDVKFAFLPQLCFF